MYFAELDWTLGTARGAQSYQILGLREKKKTEWTVLNDSWGPFTSETPTNVSLSYIPVMRKEILENSVPREKKKKKCKRKHLLPCLKLPITGPQGRYDFQFLWVPRTIPTKKIRVSVFLRLFYFIHLLAYSFTVLSSGDKMRNKVLALHGVKFSSRKERRDKQNDGFIAVFILFAL